MVSDLMINGPLNLASAIFDIQDALGKGFSATEIVLSGARMGAGAINLARPAMVPIRLDKR